MADFTEESDETSSLDSECYDDEQPQIDAGFDQKTGSYKVEDQT
jgi:hypothetical protein